MRRPRSRRYARASASAFRKPSPSNARLQEDYDEPGWWRVVVEVALPESLPVDVWLDQNRRYYERLYARIPLAQTPLFVMSHEYRAE